MSLTILSQLKCTLTKHTVPADDEDLLFDLNQSRVETECEKCHTPLVLEKSETEDNVYYISEYIEED